MPKLSKRKRQLKEIHQRKSEEGNGDGENNSAADENEEEEVEEPPPKPVQPSSSGGRNTKSAAKASAAAQSQAQPANEPVWVQCNNCDKWRSLPSTVDPNTLPDIWTCDLNVYDPARANCEAPEENYNKEDDVHAPQRQFLRVWIKRLRSSDRAEHRLATNTRVKKRKSEVEWIRCSNPSCGKWRAISRNIDSNVLLTKFFKNKHFAEQGGAWYCCMNSWDETMASCSAPQEPLWNCRWNLNA
eukprot:scaffold369_cov177-Ochromonas_danica.AAC.14